MGIEAGPAMTQPLTHHVPVECCKNRDRVYRIVVGPQLELSL